MPIAGLDVDRALAGPLPASFVLLPVPSIVSSLSKVASSHV